MSQVSPVRVDNGIGENRLNCILNYAVTLLIQWALTNLNSLGPELISESFGLVMHFKWRMDCNAPRNSHEYH